MPKDQATLIVQIHASPLMVMLVVTGGGAQALADLLAAPGASRTVLEALVPYSPASLTDFLGTLPKQVVSVETAAALARTAYQRASTLHSEQGEQGEQGEQDEQDEQDEQKTSVVGVSCTAALMTDRPKKGEHRAHLGVSSSDETRVYSLTLTKGARDRREEERVVSDLVLAVLALTCGIPVALNASLLAKERVTIQVMPPPKG